MTVWKSHPHWSTSMDFSQSSPIIRYPLARIARTRQPSTKFRPARASFSSERISPRRLPKSVPLANFEMSFTTAYVDTAALDQDYEFLHKLLLIGDSSVGKSSIVQRFSDDSYSESFISTIGVDLKIRTFEDSSGRKVKLQLWDTAGQERFRAITTSYFRGADCVLLVYDRTDPRTLRSVAQTWLAEVERFASENVLLYLIGNKQDLVHSDPLAREKARECDALIQDLLEANPRVLAHLSTSAKTGSGVDEAFDKIAQACSENVRRRKLPGSKTKLRGHKQQGSSGWGSIFSFCSIL